MSKTNVPMITDLSEENRKVAQEAHAWNAERFWIDGPYSSAFAAQPLAARGVAVVQVEEDLAFRSTPKEIQHEIFAYEGAIDFLDREGLIDRNRIGIIGFSRTGFAVKQMLALSRSHLAAATIADGNDAGYFSYLAYANSSPSHAPDCEGIIGAAPFGNGLRVWMENSPSFRLTEVITPLRLEAYEPASILSAWEWFAGLRRLGKPVDFIYLPDATHVLVKPSDRLISQQGNVDWFCFWLKGEEDPDPAKAEQYKRWRELRKLQEGNQNVTTH